MEIKRGYVKWTDEDGVFHKELLVDHPELLKGANVRDQIAAEEARRLNEDGKKQMDADEAEDVEAEEMVLEALVSAPSNVLTTAGLDTVTVDGETLIVPADEAIITPPVVEKTPNGFNNKQI